MGVCCSCNSPDLSIPDSCIPTQDYMSDECQSTNKSRNGHRLHQSAMMRSWIQAASRHNFTPNVYIFIWWEEGKNKNKRFHITSGGVSSYKGQVCPFDSRFMVTLQLWLRFCAWAMWGLLIRWPSKLAAMPCCLPGLQPLTLSLCLTPWTFKYHNILL